MYTDPIQWADMRHRILVERRSIRSVCRDLSISRKTVRKMVRREQPRKFKHVERATRIGSYRDSSTRCSAKMRACPGANDGPSRRFAERFRTITVTEAAGRVNDSETAGSRV